MTMALIAHDSCYYRLIDSLYKSKNYITLRGRYFKEHKHQIFGYCFEQEILVLEQLQKTQELRYVFKYKNKKRFYCKLKRKNSLQRPIGDACCVRITRACHIRFLSEEWGDMLAGTWHQSLLPAVCIQTVRSSSENRMEKSSFARKLLTQYLSSESSTVTSLQSKPEHIDAESAVSSDFILIHKSSFCDMSNHYWDEKFNKKIRLVTYKKKQRPVAQQRHTKVRSLQTICYYLFLMFLMIVRELIRYINVNISRVRRKTQFFLPIFILLQLLLAVPMTYCTSPPHQTSEALVSSPMHFAPLSNPLVRELSSPVVETESTSTAALDKLSGPVVRQYQVPASSTLPLYRPSGGSSITSYLSYESQARRDPSQSYTNIGCHSCQMREQVKADNLESIKRHILLRLEMHTLPNITTPIVPHTIIENFYKNYSRFDNKNQISTEVDSSENEKSSSVYKTLPISKNKYEKGTKPYDQRMQADDPNIFSSENSNKHHQDNEHDEDFYHHSFEDEFFSVVDNVYVFPTMPRMRHNRKTEILNFKVNGNDHSTVTQALLHVYIRGRDWMREYEPAVLNTVNKSPDNDRREIVITVNRVVRRANSTTATHTVNVTESHHKIPHGLGEWVSIDVTRLVHDWLLNTTSNQGIVIKGSECWMKPFIIVGDSLNNKAFTVYIQMITKNNRKRRTKRNTSMNCSESDNEERCCRYPLVVNFVEFDWTWVVAPTHFNAYFCNGECKLGFLEKYPHTHLMQLSTAPQPCCSPTKMSPLQLLYFNTENILVMSTIPNMAVDKCSCS